ncbi:MAG: hypothetical protein ACOZAM_15545 [Pseudomonadota bacterium]
MIEESSWFQHLLMFGFGAAAYSLVSFGKPRLMRSIQIAIIIVIILSNSYYPWTTSPYLPLLVGIAAAWLPTRFKGAPPWMTISSTQKHRLPKTDRLPPVTRAEASRQHHAQGGGGLNEADKE